LKIATHVRGSPTDAETLDRTARQSDEDDVRRALREFIPDGNGPLLSLRVCMYTNSPDQHFIIDRHPKHANVIIACGFSGHGFKCASAIGQVLAELAMNGHASLPIEFLGLKRFGIST
jgi:glycine/D-amino acid oxidase-like deaminating enzyme